MCGITNCAPNPTPKMNKGAAKSSFHCWPISKTDEVISTDGSCQCLSVVTSILHCPDVQ